MLFPAFLAALAAIPAVSAQTSDITSTLIRCTTRFGFYPVPSGTAGVPTWYNYATTTNVFSVTSTTQDTVTVTASATTLTDIVTTTQTVDITTTSTPAATTIAAPSGFLPLMDNSVVSPTPVPRIKRAEMSAREPEVFHPHRRQTAPGNTGGYIVLPDGSSGNYNRIYPRRIDCAVTVVVNRTVTTIEIGIPVTDIGAQPTDIAVITTTETVTNTVTAVLPAETIYAACASNNILDRITDVNGKTMYFDRAIYRPNEGFPIANELVTNTTCPITCCIACQNTPFCAGSFYVPSAQECHLRLTQPFIPFPPTLPSGTPIPTSNITLATATATDGVMSILALAPGSTGTPVVPGNGTCADGNRSLYLGTIRGQENFPAQYAMSVSNGPCGRWTVWPVPVPATDNVPEIVNIIDDGDRVKRI